MSPGTADLKHNKQKVNLDGPPPLVSIIMPVYNRARFLADAIYSIQSQSYKNWELIIIDDGSSDKSVELLVELTANITNSVTIINQTNQGPAAARNNGISRANGAFFAFFDSDDLWKPHHVSNCVNALIQHPELSWVYSACERIDYETGDCLQSSTFYTEDRPNKLFDIATRQNDGLYILDTEQAILLQLTQGLDNGLQNSVLKKDILEHFLIPNYRVGEDRLFIVMALKNGFQMGFIDAIHVRYHVHDQNISDTNKKEGNFKKRIEALESLIHAKKQLPSLVNLTSLELKVYNEKLAKEVFWELGYSLYQASGNLKMAILCYFAAIKLAPNNYKFYRTTIITSLKLVAATFKRRK